MDNSTVADVFQSNDIVFDPVSIEVRHVFELANFIILCTIISLFGIGSNVANICVFVRQGFKDTINISLMGLAVSDLICSMTLFWASVCFNPLFHKLDLPVTTLELSYITASYPHVCFNRVTSFITAFITLERCLCIAMPLKVKIIITSFRTKVIIASIFIFTIFLFSPFYFVNKLAWKYDANRNRSVIGIVYTDGREIVDSTTFFLHSVLLSSSLLVTVIVCTIILVYKLNKKAKWRSGSVAQMSSKQDTVSTKDNKVAKMITLIAIIFIVCYLPPTVNFVVMTYNTEFSLTGKLTNVFHLIWSVTFVLQALNSSVNIFVYFKMSSKFKDTFCELFKGRFIKET